jgi:hypothetical protein
MRRMQKSRDSGRIQADKILGQTERAMGRVYDTDPALIRIQKKLAKYLDGVRKDTQALYDAYKDANDDDKPKAKQAYSDAVREKTIGSTKYNSIIKEFTEVLAQVNQKALDVANGSMVDVYTVSYNNVADECERVGMRVNGKK